jgi:hypothetical protein
MPIWIVLAIVLIALLAGVFVVSKERSSRRTRTSEPSSGTDVEYDARNGRIPNLEETLKAYAFPQRGGPEARDANAASPLA